MNLEIICCYSKTVLMALAHRTWQSGNATTLQHGAIRKQDGDWPPNCRVAALPLYRVLCARAIRSETPYL